jgi:hypothetical protein
MPLTKQELVERCDKLYEAGIQANSPGAMGLALITYISTSAFFKEITNEESHELIITYLNKNKDFKNKK